MAKKVCAQPGCPLLGEWKRGRCPEHARQVDAARGTSTERGFGTAHNRLKAQWQRRIDSGEHITCWRCGVTLAGRDWHLGHDDHDRTLYRGPECPPCNLSAAGRAAHGLPPKTPGRGGSAGHDS